MRLLKTVLPAVLSVVVADARAGDRDEFLGCWSLDGSYAAPSLEIFVYGDGYGLRFFSDEGGYSDYIEALTAASSGDVDFASSLVPDGVTARALYGLAGEETILVRMSGEVERTDHPEWGGTYYAEFDSFGDGLIWRVGCPG
jgi:hypothetical protein